MSNNASHKIYFALVLASSVLLGAGLFLPMMRIEKWFVFADEVSVVSGLVDLATEGQWGIFILIGFFSVLFPIIKLLLLMDAGRKTNKRGRGRRFLFSIMSNMAKWSMLDVFVVAVLVVTVKLGGIAHVEVRWGFYFFVASVLMTMALTHWQKENHNLASIPSKE